MNTTSHVKRIENEKQISFCVCVCVFEQKVKFGQQEEKTKRFRSESLFRMGLPKKKKKTEQSRKVRESRSNNRKSRWLGRDLESKRSLKITKIQRECFERMKRTDGDDGGSNGSSRGDRGALSRQPPAGEEERKVDDGNWKWRAECTLAPETWTWERCKEQKMTSERKTTMKMKMKRDLKA